jgi:hypothetical protein
MSEMIQNGQEAPVTPKAPVYTSTGKLRKETEKGTVEAVTISYFGEEFTYCPARKVTEAKADELRAALTRVVPILKDHQVEVVTVPAKGRFVGQAKTSRALIVKLVKEENLNTEEICVFLNVFIKYCKPADFDTHGVNFTPYFYSSEVINELKTAFGLKNHRSVERNSFAFDDEDQTLADTSETTEGTVIAPEMELDEPNAPEMDAEDEEEIEG